MLGWIKKKCLPYLMAYTIKLFLSLLIRSCRVEVHGLEHLFKAADEHPTILILWHNQIVILPSLLSKCANDYLFAAAISKSSDVDFLALLTLSYSNGRVLRVPYQTRHHALNEIIQRLKTKKETIIITPDGPKGPFFVVKPGVVFAARETGAHIIPFAWRADRTWTLSTRDRMIIPKPFSKIIAKFGPATTVSHNEENITAETERLCNAIALLMEKR